MCQDSVFNGFNVICDWVVDVDWVLVYDVVCFGLDVLLLDCLLDVLVDDEVGGLLVVLVVDILKCGDGGVFVCLQDIVLCVGLWVVQILQMFFYVLLQCVLCQV